MPSNPNHPFYGSTGRSFLQTHIVVGSGNHRRNKTLLGECGSVWTHSTDHITHFKQKNFLQLSQNIDFERMKIDKEALANTH